MAKLIKDLWRNEDKKYLLALGERGLKSEMGRQDKGPTPLDNRLRLQFWLEFDRMQTEDDRGPEMQMQSVLGTLVPKEVFYLHYIVDPFKLAWLLCPPLNYVVSLEETLTFALDQLRESIAHPIQRDDGGVNISYAEYVMKAHSKLHAHMQAISKNSRYIPKGVALGSTGQVEGAEQLSIQERLAQKKAEAEKLRKQTMKEPLPPQPDVAE